MSKAKGKGKTLKKERKIVIDEEQDHCIILIYVPINRTMRASDIILILSLLYMNELLKSIIFQVTVQYNIIREQIHAISITFDDLTAYICFCELTY